MKINFNKEYKSIKGFKGNQEIELSDFSVIIGKNGVGKSHFLEGFVSTPYPDGSEDPPYFVIENGLSSIYFDYKNFDLSNKNNIFKRSKNPDSFEKEKGAIVQEYQEKIVNQLLEKSTTTTKTINRIIEKLIIFNLCIKVKEDFTLDIYEDITTQSVKNQYHLILLLWGERLQEYLSNNEKQIVEEGKIAKLSKDELKEIIERFYQELKKFVKDIKVSPILRKYLKLASKYKININGLGINHINESYQENYLGELFEQEIKSYLASFSQKIKDFDRNFLDPENEEKSVKQIKEELIKNIEQDLGMPPWEILNKILENYNHSGYLIDAEEFEDFLTKTKNNLKQGNINKDIDIPTVRLKNIKNGIAITPDDLSSGERVLFALVLTLYRQSKDGNLPDVLLLDEIDSSLHPSMCENFLKTLKEIFVKEYEIKIILVTQSPYTVSLSRNDSIYIMDNQEGIVDFEKQSIGEDTSIASIMLEVFGIYTTDLHNELYGWLEFFYRNYHQTQEKNRSHNFDEFLIEQLGIEEGNKKTYINARNNNNREESISLHAYIRNQIHHPENGENEKYTIQDLNEKYTIQDLRDSIESLIKLKQRLIKSLNKEKSAK